MARNKLTYLSLFSGIGGLDYGLEKAGYQNLGCIEYDHDAILNLKFNRDWNLFEGDIREFSTNLVKRRVGLKKNELDLLVGGPPCQSYSKSSFWAEGIKRGYSDKRGKLIDEYIRFVEELLPKSFLIENVPGFVYSNQNQGMKQVLKFVKRLKREKGIEYKLSYKVVNCANYGVPQKRERVFIVGNRLGVDFTFPDEKFGPKELARKSNGVIYPFKTARDAFHNIERFQKDEDLRLGGKWADLVPCIPPGENYQYLTDQGEGETIFNYRSRYWTFLLKLHPKMPSWTIQASPGSSTGPFHWDNRKLSSREIARIQTLPDDIELVGNRSSLQKLIGNAVPSLMGEVLGKQIKRQIFSKRIASTDLLIPKTSGKIFRPRFKSIVPSEFRLH